MESAEHKLKTMAKSRAITSESFCMLFFVHFLMFSSSCFCCPRYQKEALLRFKFLLVGNVSSNSTKYLKSWNSSTSDCCKWKLVSCSRQHQVTALDLKALTFFLHLKPQSVTSDVLAPLFHLKTLTALDISVNDIRGEIQGVGFANLSNLVELKMNRNSFDGTIPPELFSLMHLGYLHMSDNLIRGTLESSFGNFSELKWLYLENNKISGAIPSSIFHLKELEELDLGYNLFSAAIPTEVGNLSNVRVLCLGGNHLSGEIPPSIQELKMLEILNLGNNSLSGKIPAFLFQSRVLSSLVLSRNNFSGFLPKRIGEASMISELDLSSNNLEGQIPKAITTMSSLFLLDLSRNKFSFFESPLFDPNSVLAYADLSFNKISGDIPATIPLDMEVLILSHNDFSGVLPQSLANLSNLKYLVLRDNHITGDVPVFSSLSILQVLILRNNTLKGSIPFELSNLSSLRVLDLSSNNLSGKIPSSLGNLSGMNTNYDSSSSFGTYDRAHERHGYWQNYWEEFTGMHDLELYWKESWQIFVHLNRLMYFLDLSNNQLSGEIPGSLGDLRYLKSLNLSNNMLSGRIPPAFGDLESLESLDLSHNNLSGEIPSTFANLSQLTYLNLKNNNLQGRIPKGPQMNTMNDPESYANNDGLCGMQIQVPCEKMVLSPEPNNPPEKETMMFAEIWFSWEVATIGYFSGFLSTSLVMYVNDYFNVAASSPTRRKFVFLSRD